MSLTAFLGFVKSLFSLLWSRISGRDGRFTTQADGSTPEFKQHTRTRGRSEPAAAVIRDQPNDNSNRRPESERGQHQATRQAAGASEPHPNHQIPCGCCALRNGSRDDLDRLGARRA
jgi:hypothetical protein